MEKMTGYVFTQHYASASGKMRRMQRVECGSQNADQPVKCTLICWYICFFKQFYAFGERPLSAWKSAFYPLHYLQISILHVATEIVPIHCINNSLMNIWQQDWKCNV